MATLSNESKKQSTVRMIILVAAVFVVTWAVTMTFINHHQSNSSDSGDDVTIGAPIPLGVTGSPNPQPAGSLPQAPAQSIQSGQPNLQPAQTNGQIPAIIKQELGL